MTAQYTQPRKSFAGVTDEHARALQKRYEDEAREFLAREEAEQSARANQKSTSNDSSFWTSLVSGLRRWA